MDDQPRDRARALTDERVLRTLMQRRQLTRAELAATIGISKPTAGESVRRLTEAGLVADTGERTPGGRGRGRVGSYYALSSGIGTALAVSIAPGGVRAERLDVYGDVTAHAERKLDRPAHPDEVAAALLGAALLGSALLGSALLGATMLGAAGEVGGQPGPRGQSAAGEVRGRPGTSGQSAAGEVAGRPRLAVVSAADPVDRGTGRLVQLPDSPFLVGDLDPAGLLAPLVDGPVTVDNDVNWAARAERDHDGRPLDDFAYLYLGEGLGCALVSDGEVRRGGSGLAGEVAHLVVTGPQGRAMPFIEVFDALGLRRPGSTAIDVDRLLTAATGPAALSGAVRAVLGEAVSSVLAAVVALTDPTTIVIGGPWGTDPAILATIGTAFTGHRRHVPLQAATVTTEPALAGARTDAINRLRSTVVAAAQQTPTAQ